MSDLPTHSKLPDQSDTRERLLQAGMRVFAERGYADAGIREICRRAGANPAAVNYHFGDKQRFYTEVLATCHARAADRGSMPTLADDPAHPERVLRRCLAWFLRLLLVRSEEGPLGRLMAREMVDPSPALDEVVRRSFLPIKFHMEQILRAILRQWTGPDRRLDERSVRMAFNSTVSQCLFYKHSSAALGSLRRLATRGDELTAEERVAVQVFVPGPDDIDDLADHITHFAVAGLRATVDALEARSVETSLETPR